MNEQAKGRADGRAYKEWRETETETYKDAVMVRQYTQGRSEKRYASAIVLYGSVEVKKPENDQKGMLAIHCTDKSIQTALEKIYKEGRCVPCEQLTIVPKTAVWCVHIEVHIVNNKGGILQIATEGVNRVLQRTVLEKRNKTEESTAKELTMMYTPQTKTVVYRNNTEALYDPAEEEEEGATGKLTITINEDRDVVYMVFTGSIEVEALLQSIGEVIQKEAV